MFSKEIEEELFRKLDEEMKNILKNKLTKEK